MNNYFFSFLFMFFTYFSSAQNSVNEFVNLSLGVHDGHQPAMMKVISEGENTTFSFVVKTQPNLEFKINQIERFNGMSGFVSLKDEDDQVGLIVNSSMEMGELKRLLLFTSRLYGYVGFKVTE